MKNINFCRYVIMGITILICPFLPASNIFFNVGFVLAERVLYIPSAGYCLLVAIGLQKFSVRFSLPKTSLLAYIMLIVLLFIRSWIRSNQWRNEKLLFQSALDVCPLNAKVHYNIAKNAADAGNFDLAKLEYQEALRYHNIIYKILIFFLKKFHCVIHLYPFFYTTQIKSKIYSSYEQSWQFT